MEITIASNSETVWALNDIILGYNKIVKKKFAKYTILQNNHLSKW